MASGWRYRAVSVLGVATFIIGAVVVSNLQPVQEIFALVPYFGQPAPHVLPADQLFFRLGTGVIVGVASLWPLFKPRPRRILDTILLTQKRVVLWMVVLAALGYYNYTYQIPRPTLMLSTAILLFVLPAFTVSIRRKPQSGSRTIIVGDDPDMIRVIRDATEREILGCVSTPAAYEGEEPDWVGESEDGLEDRQLPRLGGFSRLEEVLVQRDVDNVVFAFASSDREEFFGTLEVCYEHGITAMVHRDHADHVLTAGIAGDELLEVDLEPWDWQDYIVKRLFDITFAAVGLLVLTPVMAVIAAAIKLDSPGPVLYGQERTATFGETFRIYKFRSMIPNAEAETGATVSAEDAGGVDPRVTRVGHILRRTHLDEIPQLWSILVGDMSVVGPRPERPELDADMARGTGQWQRRWFVKPGLTGLAQIRGATGHDPDTKLRYDIEYIRSQSLWFDLKILIRQLWAVWVDTIEFVWADDEDDSNTAETADRNTAGDSLHPETADIDPDSAEPEADTAVQPDSEGENITDGGRRRPPEPSHDREQDTEQ